MFGKLFVVCFVRQFDGFGYLELFSLMRFSEEEKDRIVFIVCIYTFFEGYSNCVIRIT